MTQKFRFILYAVVGLTIPVLSWLIYPELGWKEPVSFITIVLVLATVIEVVYHFQGKK